MKRTRRSNKPPKTIQSHRVCVYGFDFLIVKARKGWDVFTRPTSDLKLPSPPERRFIGNKATAGSAETFAMVWGHRSQRHEKAGTRVSQGRVLIDEEE